MYKVAAISALQHARGIACAVLWGALEVIALARSRRSASRLQLPRH